MENPTKRMIAANNTLIIIALMRKSIYRLRVIFCVQAHITKSEYANTIPNDDVDKARAITSIKTTFKLRFLKRQ